MWRMNPWLSINIPKMPHQINFLSAWLLRLGRTLRISAPQSCWAGPPGPDLQPAQPAGLLTLFLVINPWTLIGCRETIGCVIWLRWPINTFHNKGRKDQKKCWKLLKEIERRQTQIFRADRPYAATVSQLDDLQYIQLRQDPSRSWICYRDLEIWTSLQSCTRMPKTGDIPWRPAKTSYSGRKR